MAAPTFVAEYETAWNADTTPKALNVTTAVGDVLVIIGMIENGLASLNTPTGGTGLTWTLRQSISLGSDWCAVYVWTATATTAQTFSCSVSRSGSTGAWWGWVALRWSGSGGVGASSKANASGAPSLGLTTTAANSAICIGNADWNAADGTSRTWRSVNGSPATEQSYFRNSSRYTLYAGRHTDAGAAGAKTVGLSAPAGQKYSITAVEVLGTSASTTTGTLNATAPMATADLDGTVRITGALAATAPLGTGDISGTVHVTGSLSATAPKPTADMTGTVTIAGTMAGTAPIGTASITGTVEGVVTGTMSATAPAPTADIDGTVTVTGTLDATSPIPLASFGGSVTVADAERNTPWRLAITTRGDTLTIDAPSRTLALETGAGRTVTITRPPTRTLEVDAPVLTLAIDTHARTLEVDA